MVKFIDVLTKRMEWSGLLKLLKIRGFMMKRRNRGS